MGDAVKINVTAAPVDGKANACLGRYLAKQFHVPVSRVALVKGRNHYKSDRDSQLDRREVKGDAVQVNSSR